MNENAFSTIYHIIQQEFANRLGLELGHGLGTGGLGLSKFFYTYKNKK